MPLPIQRAHLDGLVVFVAVAELRGFRAAARQLGVTPSAISQTIRALEQRVGAPHLSRTTRSVGLTEAGERLLVHARPAMEMLSLGLDAAASLGDDVSGRLRINLARSVLPLLANRLLPDFLEAYPNVQLELCGDDNFIDIVEQGFDAGIRMAELVPTDMIAVPLTPRIRFAVVAAASYVRKHGRPSHPRELEQFNCIQLRRWTGSIFDWNFVAVLRGVGFARPATLLVMSYIENGEMETALDEYADERPGLMLYYPSRSQSLPKLRAFTRFAQKRMRRDFRAEDYLPIVLP